MRHRYLLLGHLFIVDGLGLIYEQDTVDSGAALECRSPLSIDVGSQTDVAYRNFLAVMKHVDDDDDDDDENDDDDEDLEYSLERNVWGKPQVVYLEQQDAIEKVLNTTNQYMTVFLNEEPSDGRYDCRNYEVKCSSWASAGDCVDEDQEDFMVESCSPACQTCDKYLERFYEPKAVNEDETDTDEPDEPGIVKPTMWGVAQIMVESVSAEILEDILEATDEYMLETVVEDPDVAKDVWANCENKYPYCTYWAAQGECEENPAYMDLNCAPTCGTCDMFEYHRRCPVPEGTEALKEPGDLNSIFERIVTDDFWVDNYGPIEILSSPELTDGPWIITLENFLNEEECKGFIEAATEEGYVRSKNLATEENEDGTVNSILSEGRTSSTSWCYSECVESSILKPVHERLEKLTGIHYNYSEYLQLLKYEVGEFYEEHHDYADVQIEQPPGPRILTAFMYLNDVEGGGGTQFGSLNLIVQPKQGKMVLWPSVLDDDPLDWDPRTMHEALPVTNGTKYGSNAWIHLREYKGPSDKGCA